MKKSFKYRIYSNKDTIQKAETWLSLCRQLYNDYLSERIIAYKERGESISQYDQMKNLPQFKKDFPDFKQVNSQTLQDVIERLDKAYQAFFRRVKAGEKAGFPRFKGVSRYNSFTFTQSGWKLEGKYLTLKNIGRFKLKFSRPIEGIIKTIIIQKSSTDKWYVIFSCDKISAKLLPKTGKIIGIDIGCESFLTDSNGKKIDNPRFFKKSQELLKARQQKLSRKKEDSVHRSKARILVAKAYEKVFSQRRDFHFKVVNRLIKENDVICIEKLRSWNSFRSLNKSMRDVAWFSFFNILHFKAEYAGREVVEVLAKGTSQRCSCCGKEVLKDLSVRIHSCPFCGLNMDRDYNAALNILRLGQSLQSDLRIF